MFLFFLFPILLLILYLLSHTIVNLIFQIFYTFFRHQKLSIYLLAFFFLPGTTIHEISHFFMATLLHVKTSKISVWPEVESNGHIRAGHVEVSKTDPIRLILIGIAPMILGITAVYFISEFFFPQIYRIFNAPAAGVLDKEIIPLISLKSLAGLYLIFEITGTFFSSKRDLQSAVFVAPILGIIIFMMYISRLQVSLDRDIYEVILMIINKVNISLGIGALIQFTLLLLLHGIIFLVDPKKKHLG